MRSYTDEFEPKLGRMRQGGGAAAKRYLSRIKVGLEYVGPTTIGGRSSHAFTGKRIGRGAWAGYRSASLRHPFHHLRGRRVVVKVRLARFRGGGFGAAKAHIRYIQRDAVGRDGSPEQLYSRDAEGVDGKAFIERADGDRHQFRLILSPEDADELQSLTNYTRDFMGEVERDLGTKLDWVAVNHYNTDNPHTHIVIRGKDDLGKDLIIARDYITHGFRRRACELATDELGLRRDFDIARMQKRQVDQERFTSLDRDLIKTAEASIVKVNRSRTPYDRFRRSLLIGRLTVLKSMGLAQEYSPGEWQLEADLAPSLKAIGRRMDIVRNMQAVMGSERSALTFELFDGASPNQKPVLGRVVATGPSNELDNGRFLVVDADDGRQWHVDMEDPGAAGTPPVGAVVEVKRGDQKPRSVDLTIDRIARAYGGVYSDELHAMEDPVASAAYRETHKRRLEALRRQNIVDRLPEGSWTIPEDFLDRAQSFDARRSGNIRIQTLSWLSIDKLVEREAATWLDTALKERIEPKVPMRGFGADFSSGLRRRQIWLIEHGYAEERNGELKFHPDSLENLRQKELSNVGARLASKLHKEFAPALDGERIEGMYRDNVRLASGRYAVIERSKEFTLLPWRDILEKHRNKSLAGLVRGRDVTWDFGRKRGIGR